MSDVEMIDLEERDGAMQEFLDEMDDDSIYKLPNDFIFIDLQGFKTYGNRFICKEFCIVKGDSLYHTLVKSTYPLEHMSSYYKRQANWLTKYYHRLTYDCGDIHITELKRKVFPEIQNKKVLVKGEEKVKWLKDIFRSHGVIDCINIESLDYDLSLRKSEANNMCDYHRNVFRWREGPCAMRNALMLQDIMLQNKR